MPGIRRRRPPKLQHIDMQETTFENKVDLIRAKDPRYERDAYAFLREALEYTQQAIKKNRGRIRHISGQELLAGIREFALEKFGPMALMMLGEWGIHNCRDFGEIVFNMVESGLLQKTEKDTREDFRQGYDFTDAFGKPYWPEGKLAAQKKPVAK